MREDMCHVLIDRPRYRGYSAHRYKNFRKRSKLGDLEALPKRESVKVRYRYDPKQFSDHIRPLQRFLGKQVGRPWDKVYSEIRAQIPSTSTVKLHVLQHVKDFVMLHVVEREDGKLYDADGYRWSPLRRNELYVNRAGILCRFLGDRKKKRRLRRGEKIYVLYREKGSKMFAIQDGARYRFKLLVDEVRDFESLPPGSHREELYRFVAGTRQEALNEIEEFKKLHPRDNEFFVLRAA